MTGLGIEPRTPASLFRCSTIELSRLISTVHLARITTFLPPYKVFTLKDKHKFTLSGLINYKCLNREGHCTKYSRDGGMNKYKEIQRKYIWLDQESNLGPLHHYSGALPLSYPGRYPWSI